MEQEERQQLVRNLVVTGAVAILMGGFVLAYLSIAPGVLASGKARMMSGPIVPPVLGYAEGEEIRFIHTEASDPEVAALLTEMMDSPVLTVPHLARTPQELLATVYVFENGIEGRGPLGFQPDVFDNVPGTSGYTPLRAIHFVRWKEPGDARELRSAHEVLEMKKRGEISIEPAGVVVNMPMLSWPGGGER